MDQDMSLNRNITVYGEITDQKVEEVVKQIVAISDYDFNMMNNVVNYEPEPIKMFICSGGGMLTPVIGLCELMIHSETPIATFGMGECCSAAFMLLIAGHVRYAVRGSSLMAHQVAGGQFGSSKDCEIALQQMKRVEQYMIDLFKSRTKMTEEMIAEMYHSQIDKYLSVEEAKELKVIDHILGEVIQEGEEDGEIEDVENSDEDGPCSTEEE